MVRPLPRLLAAPALAALALPALALPGLVANAGNSNIFGQDPSVSIEHFFGGVATYHVPAGPYWALGVFGDTVAHNESYVHRLVVLPQFSVHAKTTVHIAEQAATSKVTMVTPRPATAVSTNFTVDHPGRTGPAIQINFSNSMLARPPRTRPCRPCGFPRPHDLERVRPDPGPAG